jgi:hypothetical protein
VIYSRIERDARARPSSLFLLGFLTLFLELSLIRYLPGSVWNLGYFPNLVLLAVFLGMGLGFVFHGTVATRLSARVFEGASLLLLGLVAFVYYFHPEVPGFREWSGDVAGELYFTSTEKDGGAGNEYVVFAFCWLAILLVFAAISQRTAKVFRDFPPLRAYSLDISGSCAGIVSFMLASFLTLPASTWFLAAIPLFLFAADRASRTRYLTIVPLALVAFFAWRQDTTLTIDPAHRGGFESRWSPYQKVEIAEGVRGRSSIFVNGIGHQQILSAAEMARAFYSIPYVERKKRADLPPYARVLIIGSGAGNDVTAALLHGATHVDAVEIDPVIANLGVRYNEARPYRDPRVRLIVDDGRAFMTRAPGPYDLVVFALTDSLVRVSSMAQLRLENYLFTEESIRRAYALLSETGDVMLYNQYRRPWLTEKLQRMMRAGTGHEPLILGQSEDFYIFIAGKRTEGAPRGYQGEPVENAVDDWPFPYMRVRHIPPLYAGVMAGMSVLIALLMLVLHFRGRAAAGAASLRVKLAFVFMGVAFLLLETKSVVQFSLLFGTTWQNSSLVFLAVLLLVLAANWTAVLFKDPRTLYAVYALLIGSCLLTFFFPLTNLLHVENGALRFVLASLMTFLPIFFANLIFSVTFRDQAVPEHLFGWNLMGAALGGVMEYASMALGYTALAVVVAGCYALVLGLLSSRGAAASGSADAI